MSQAPRDQNFVPTLLAVSSTDGTTPVVVYADPTTHRLLVDSASGSGTVTSVSVVSANGFTGSVATSTTTPAITLTTSINSPVLAGNGTAISAATTTGSGSTVVLSTAPTFATSITTPSVLATANDSGALGASGTAFADLFLASGGVINFNAGNVTLTHTAGILTQNAGEFRITSANVGTNADSVPTLSSTSTLTNKTLTSPTLTTPDIGVATATSINGLTITSSTGTLTITNLKVFSVTNTLTLSGTDSTVMTFPTTSATIARTDAANTFTGASTASAWVLTSPTITTKISPTADDGAPLGDTTHNFSDLFLASGAVVNFAAGNVTLTHSSGILTQNAGELRITSANVGTNNDSVPTLSSTSTLTNKTLTSPTITTSTLSGAQLYAENASIQYDSALSADGKYCGEVRAGTAGATLAFGDLIYLAAADSRWELADADSATTANVLLGMCVLAAAADGDPTLILLQGFIRADAAFPAMTISARMYVGETAGDIQGTIPTGADNIIRAVGYAWTADELYFCPSMDSQATVA